MGKEKGKRHEADELHRETEEWLRSQMPGPEDQASEDVQKLIRELQIHQIELEAQNEELRQSQIELEQTHKKYIDLYDLAPISYLTLNEQGLILEANISAARQLGTERHLLIQKPFSLYIALEDRNDFYLFLRRVFKSEARQLCEMRLIASNETEQYVQIDSIPVQDPAGNAVCNIAITDISQCKHAEYGLKRNEELLSEVLEALPVGVWIVDGKGTIMHGNPAGRRIWGGVRHIGIEQYGEYKGWWLDTGKPIEPSEWAGARAILKGEASFNEEIEIESFEGAHKIILNSAIPIKDAKQEVTGAIIVNQDITERVQKEKERARLATAVEQAAESIFIVDSKGIIQYLNPAFERISGYRRDEVIGLHHRVFKSGEHDQAFYKGMRETFRRGEVWRGRLITKRKDGDFYHAEATISPVRDAGGNIINYVTVGRDISKEIKLEKQLQQAQKMEAMGTLAGGIAHDFNNILGVIFGYTELARFQIPEDSRTRAHLEEVIKAGHRAKDLVQQILAFSRQGEQEYRPLVISLIVKEALKFLKASLPSTIEIRQEIDLSPEAAQGMALADPTQIHQVLMNLCTNAAHAMHEKGGVLEVGLSNVDLDPAAASPYPELQPGPYLKLTVKDTGYGMDTDTLDRIFEPYFTTKGAGEGTGLGLAVAHGIVKSHGGIITVESKPGEGTTFQVFLPRVEGENPEEADPSLPIRGGNECILFIDDEPAMVRMWEKLLEPMGYRIVGKTDSLDALETFRSEPDRFDLVITDQTMPYLTGMNLAKEILSIKPDIPIILCTGHSDLISSDQAKALGVREFLMKPLDIRPLSEAIRRAFSQGRGSP